MKTFTTDEVKAVALSIGMGPMDRVPHGYAAIVAKLTELVNECIKRDTNAHRSEGMLRDAEYALANPDVLHTPQQHREIIAALLGIVHAQQKREGILNDANKHAWTVAKNLQAQVDGLKSQNFLLEARCEKLQERLDKQGQVTITIKE